MELAQAMLPIIRAVGRIPPFQEWDMHTWQIKPEVLQCMKQSKSTVQKSKPTPGEITDADLFPEPGLDEGHFWIKPVYYLSAALWACSKSNEEVGEKVRRLKECELVFELGGLSVWM